VLDANTIGLRARFGDMHASFEPCELSLMSAAFTENGAGLDLLGFKPKECLSPSHTLAHAHFAVADETRLTGSEAALGALLEAMRRRGQMGLAAQSARRPSLVAMLPQAEVRGARGEVVLPEGLHLITLPWADDFRELPVPVVRADAPAAADLESAAGALVEALSGPYAPPNNPVLDAFWTALEAKALQLTEKEAGKVEDGTLPDPARWAAAAPAAQCFWRACFGDADPGEAESRKRAAGGSSRGAAKVPKAGPPETAEGWAALAAQPGALEGFTVPQLKAGCALLSAAGAGVDIKGKTKKADIVEALRAHAGGV